MLILLQPNPFTSEKIEKEVSDGISLQEIYEELQIDLPISHCMFIVNDSVIPHDKLCIIPKEQDDIFIRTLPGSSDAVGIGGALLSAVGILSLALNPAAWVVGLGILALGVIAGVYSLFMDDTAVDIGHKPSVSGKTNENNQWGIVPLVYGTAKIVPPYLAPDYTEYDPAEGDNDQYLYQMYDFGYLPSRIEEVYIGDALLLKRDGGSYVGGQSITGVTYEICEGVKSTMIPHVVRETPIQKTMGHNVYYYFTTPPGTKDIELDFSFPSGLTRINSSGKLRSRTVRFTIEYKQRNATNFINAETVTVTASTSDPYRFTKSYMVASNGGQFDIRVRRTTAEPNVDDNIRDAIAWVAVRTKKVDDTGNYIYPIHDDIVPDILAFALKIKATDQLSGTISNLSVVMSRQARWAYNGTAWVANQYTSNPADWYVDILTNERINPHAVVFNSDNFDMDALEAWHVWCDTNGYSCNGAQLQSTTLEEQLKLICGTGQAEYAIRDNKYTIIHDIPRVSPTQMFTSRNIVKDSFSLMYNFDEKSDAFLVQFMNEDLGYEADERSIAYPPGVDVNTTTTIHANYVTNANHAYFIGKFMLNAQTLRNKMLKFSTSLDALRATRGDWIKVQHDTALYGITSGRIKEVTVSLGVIVAVTVDENCPMEAGSLYGVTIRTVDDITTYRIGLSEGDNTLLLLDETVMEGAFSAGDLFSFGVRNQETTNWVIQDIQFNAGELADITAVPYDESMYDLDYGNVPAWSSSITVQGQQPAISVSEYGDTDRTLARIEHELLETRLKIFHEPPTPPYSIGDLWYNNARVYDCVRTKYEGESFAQSDWYLRSSNTFEVISRDTFNDPSPEQRWMQIPGNAAPFNIFQGLGVEATTDAVNKNNALVNDTTYWDAGSAGSLYVTDEDITVERVTSRLQHAGFLVGRQNRNSYFGKSYTNLFVSPETPANQDISLNGYVYMSCHEGSLSTTYGVATPNNPVLFYVDGTTLVSFTVTDCEAPSVYASAYLPPYTSSTAAAHSETLTSNELVVTFEVNLRLNHKVYGYGEEEIHGYGETYKYGYEIMDTRKVLCTFYKSATDYLSVVIYESEDVRVEGQLNGNAIDALVADITTGEHTIIVDISALPSVTITVDSVEYTSSLGYTFGTSSDTIKVGTDDVDYLEDEIWSIELEG